MKQIFLSMFLMMTVSVTTNIPTMSGISMKDMVTESVETVTQSLKEQEPKKIELGEYELTAYCSCAACCGSETGITASGTHVTEGRTVACNTLPMGAVIYIEDMGEFVVEDTGAMKGDVIDIYFDSHKKALEFGRQKKVIYLVQ